ncbi:HesA/MoeB/ThiF family protein [Aquimarina gracilis]|uniref:HesA/MoeB/ThiF family protein n=1 Tax=Aquimarina gracilis TaxID=874422 RepID=A0ABU5ZUZ6_9FLAO|nr:HesA/MoeB/ThiF family protein [Aquimarina gracilis]MEB3345076.1 HesA/MoeB/ThiF family protein [Aquimarina gracilis]
MNTFNSRYHRQIILPEIGEEGQKKLNSSKVLVIGAGGLGCPALQYLAAAGVGTIGIIDFDVVEISNLHRQILYGDSSVGKNKALAAKNRLEDLNPTIHVNAYPEKLTPKNAITIFSKYDIIVDGSDNFSTRYLVNDACVITDKPLVYGAIFKYEGQVSVFNYKKGPTYRCLFPEPPKAGSIPSCSEIGVLGVLPGIIGSLQANEVIKIALGIGETLHGKLLMYDSLSTQFSTFSIHRVDAEVLKVKAITKNFENTDYDLFCGIERIKEILAKDVFRIENCQCIDIREPHEQPKIESLNPDYIPLATLEKNISSYKKEQEIILFCQSGVRSRKAVEILQDHGFTNVSHVKGGAIALHEEQILKEV